MGQAFDKEGKLIGSASGDSFKDVAEKLESLGDQVKSIKMGKIPNKDDVIEIDVLKYKVTYVDKALGKIHLKIL